MTALRHQQRALFIGLDAADVVLIEQWCRAGVLPNLARLQARGTWGRMRTTAEVVHVSAWPSIFTGVTPDKHGLYHAYVMQPGHQNPVRPRPETSPVPFFWKLLSEHGKRCVVMDAFMTCPLQNFNGTQIVEWGTWSWFCAPTMLPVRLKKEIQRQFGPYPAEDHSKVGMTPLPDAAGFHQRLLAAVAKKTQVVKWLMDREEWDFFLVVFGESHPAGHYFWHFHDPSYIAHPPAGAGALQSALREVYVALDTAIGEICQHAGDHTLLFLVSGDGMGPNYSGSHLLTDLLARMGLFNNMPAQRGTGGTPEHALPAVGVPAKARTDLLSTMRNMLPKQVRVAVSRAILPRAVNERLSLRWKTAGIVWEHTRAFLIENANEGYIRINLQGREPLGTVAPGKEYEDLCADIVQTVRHMTNPSTGKRAALTVYKTDEIFAGPCRSQLPDIIVHWDEEARVTTALLTEKYGLVRSTHPGCALSPYYSGNHRPHAFTLVVGPDIPCGELAAGAHILDLAPTLLAHFGIPPPAYMDGKALTPLCSPVEGT